MRMPRRSLVLAIMATIMVAAVGGWFVATYESDAERFHRIKVGMGLDVVKQIFHEKEPIELGFNGRHDSRSRWFHWSLDHGTMTVTVDEDQRVAQARYAYTSAFDRWLCEAAAWAWINYPPKAHVITIP
jgi:hypothetical protein